MQNTILIPFVLLTMISFYTCSNVQVNETKKTLDPTEFSEKIKQLPTATLIDVRTPEEYSKGHLQNAMNIDWNGNDFEKSTSTLDKSKPVFVYCLSGGRSSSAAENMRAKGFTEVYELKGGITEWLDKGFPEATDENVTPTEMSKAQYDSLLITDKLVLVDFYAEWCGPCKKMTPFLEELKTEMKDKVVIIRINVDESPALAAELNIRALPTLFLYKDKKLTWSNVGYISKRELTKHLN